LSYVLAYLFLINLSNFKNYSCKLFFSSKTAAF